MEIKTIKRGNFEDVYQSPRAVQCHLPSPVVPTNYSSSFDNSLLNISSPKIAFDASQLPMLRPPDVVIEENIILLKSITKAGHLAVRLAKESYFGLEVMK